MVSHNSGFYLFSWRRTFDSLVVVEYAAKRSSAVETNERLQQEAQAVLDVIENPDVAQSLRQDKMQNLQYLKDNYGVPSPHSDPATLIH